AQRHRGTKAQRHKGTEAQRNKVSRFRGFKGSSDIENKHRLKHIDVHWNNFSFVVELNFSKLVCFLPLTPRRLEPSKP
ncbi:hypothetical protein ACFL0B_06975, partial [Thermodesulfobacteriota bacterium]